MKMNLFVFVVIVGCISYTSSNKIVDYVCREKISKIEELEHELKSKMELIDEMNLTLTKTSNDSMIVTGNLKNIESQLGKCTDDSRNLTSTLDECKVKSLNLEQIVTLIKNVIEQAFNYTF